MSASDLSLHRPHVAKPFGTSNLIFWMVTLSLLPILAIFGGMRFLILGLAAGLAGIVWVRPKEAPAAGLLFLFAAGIILPYGARFDVTGPTWQMYYWATGLLIITLTAVLRIGLSRVWMMPRSAKAFLVAAVAAALYAYAHGAATSYVLRQLYGVLLLIAYLAIALYAGDHELLLRRILTFGVFTAICFFIYYAAVFGRYGFHKEMGFDNTQASLMAIVLFLAGVKRKRKSWILGALVLLLVPTLLLQRGDVLTFLLAVPIGISMMSQSRRRRLLCYAAAAFIALPAIFPPVAQMAGKELLKAPVIGKHLPAGVASSGTLLDRTIQLAGAISVVRSHPLFGAGLGANFVWDNPSQGAVQTEFIDSGWGYLLEKMGLLGTAAFFWLLVTIALGFSKNSPGLTACLLAVIIAKQFDQPAFFHFTTAPFLGTYAGLLLAEKRRRLISKRKLAGQFATAAA